MPVGMCLRFMGHLRVWKTKAYCKHENVTQARERNFEKNDAHSVLVATCVATGRLTHCDDIFITISQEANTAFADWNSIVLKKGNWFVA